LIILKKCACLFFDQVNIYAKILCGGRAQAVPSTDLSTDFVDKPALDEGGGENVRDRLLSRKL
jgi:hypothetical protein